MESNDDSNQYILTGWRSGVAGATSGLITRFVNQPLDVIKIRFQLQISPIRVTKESKYTSMFQAVKVIVKEESILGLWKGHIPAQYLSIVFGAVQFSTYEMLTYYVTNKFQNNIKGWEPLINIGTGSAAGVAATVLSFPFDIVRTYLIFQSEPKVYNGMLSVLTHIYKTEGLRGFTKGMVPACFQMAPMSGLVFCFHGIFKQSWLSHIDDNDSTTSSSLSTTGSMTSGLLAGLCAKTIVYPFDLMKKRLQIQGFGEKHSFSKQMYKCSGLLHCFVLTYKNEGFLGLFKGFTPSIIKAGAATSVYFTVYDKVSQFLYYTNI